MPLSRYHTVYADPDHSGSVLLYSTRKGSLIRISEQQLSAIQNGSLSDATRDTLRRLELWVDNPAAERETMAGLVDLNNNRSKKFQATVVLTLDCNLACPYCFEDHFRGNFAMTDATADELVAYVEREQIGKGRDVSINFYGGEPLMAVPMLKNIAGRLMAAAQTAGTKFSCSMVTNGTLLTRAVVEELLPFALTAAQITLDGPPEIHDQQRPFASGSGSFATIIANLKVVCDLITLKPGGNFSQENYREFPAMLDHLLDAGIDPKKVDPVQFAPIRPKSGPSTGHDTSCCGGNEPWLVEATLFLREETLRRGFAVLKPTMAICMIELANALVVNYDGSLYKCPAFMGWPELAVGTVATGVEDYCVSHNLESWHNDECLDCPYLPLCFGGCRLIPLQKSGSMAETDCRREFYDAALEQLILQDVRYSCSHS